MNNGRVQVRDLQGNNQLRPAGIQSDTYAPPPKPIRDNRAAQLAEALGSFSGSVGRLGGILAATGAEDNKKKKEQEAWALEKKLSGMTREEYVSAVESGQIPVYADEFKQKAVQSAFGTEYGSHRVSQLKEHMMTEFDWDNGDIDEYLRQATAEDLEMYGSDRNFGQAYLRQVNSIRNWALDYAGKRKTEQFIEAQGRAAFGHIDTLVKNGTETGSEPGKLAALIFSEYEVMGKEGTLGVDNKQLDQEVLNVARRYASTNPELALALINYDNNGRTLMDNPNMRDMALQIASTANNAMGERAEKIALGQVRDRNVELYREGNGDLIEDFTYVDHKGEEKTIKADKLREDAKRGFFETSEKIAEANRENPNETLGRELRSTRLSGEKHPKIETAVANIAATASIDLLQDPEGKQKMMQKLNSYKWLKNESTNAVFEYTKEEDREFAETWLIAQQYLGQDEDTALVTAIKARNITKEGMPSMSKSQRADIENQVDGFIDKAWGWDNPLNLAGNYAPANFAHVHQKITRTANTLIALGNSPEKAIEAAGEMVKQSTVVYNGQVLDLQGMSVPDNFQESVDASLADFAEKNKEFMSVRGLELSDLSIQSVHGTGVSGGRFIIVDESGLPLTPKAGSVATITLSKLRKDASARQLEKEVEIGREAAKQNSIKQNNIKEVNKPFSDGPTYYDPQGREVVPTFTDKSMKPTWKPTGKRQKTRKQRRDERNVLTD